MNRLDFENRTAVVTGGAAGIGLAIARRFAASGARVALCVVPVRSLLRSLASVKINIPEVLIHLRNKVVKQNTAGVAGFFDVEAGAMKAMAMSNTPRTSAQMAKVKLIPGGNGNAWLYPPVHALRGVENLVKP